MIIPMPIEFWPLNNTLVGLIKKSVLISGNGQDYFTNGKLGKAINGDGVNRWWYCPNIVTPADELSISFWLYSRTTDTDFRRPFSLCDANFYGIYTQDVGTLFFTLADSHGTFSVVAPIVKDTWSHYVVSWGPRAGGGSKARIWYNNVEQTIGESATVYVPNGIALNISLAALFAGTSKSNSDIDIVGVWDCILNASYVNYLWHNGVGRELGGIHSVDGKNKVRNGNLYVKTQTGYIRGTDLEDEFINTATDLLTPNSLIDDNTYYDGDR